MTMHQIVIQLKFDPRDDDVTRAIFEDHTARTLYLLWRRNHIVSQNFAKNCRSIAAVIHRKKPQTANELRECFPWGLHDFPPGDIDRFCPEVIPFFCGERQITWRLDMLKKIRG